MRQFIITALGILMWWVLNSCLSANKLEAGDCYISNREYCVIKLVDDGFYNTECTFDNQSRKAVFFSSRKRYYEVDFSSDKLRCPRNIKE